MADQKPKTTVTNQSDLARELSCSPAALKSWLHDHQYATNRPTREANNTYKVAKYKRWMVYHGLSGKAEPVPQKSQEQQLKTRLTEIKVQQEEAKLKKMRGDLVEKASVVEALGKGMAYFYRELDRVFGDEIPPRTRGLTEKQMSALMREEIKTIFIEAKRRFKEGFEEL